MKKMDVYAYAKLSKEQKQDLLRDQGLLVEMEKDGNDVTCLYFVCGFFVEVTSRNGEEIENIPYKRGFKASAVCEEAA